MALMQDTVDAIITVKDLLEAVHVDSEVWSHIESELGGTAEDVARASRGAQACALR